MDSSPAIGQDGTVYVGSNDGHLYALNPNGTLKWKFQTGSAVTSSPAIAQDGTIYVGSADGNLYAIGGAASDPPTEAPQHVSPTNSATGVALRPTFTWGAVSGASRYGLYISKPPYGEANLVFQKEDLTGTSFTLPSDLQEGVTYRWNMRAGNEAGWGPFSQAWQFTTLITPPPANQIRGVDVSRPGEVPLSVWQRMKEEGWEFVIVQAWGGRRPNLPGNGQPGAERLLGEARAAGMKTAAYCLLNFDNLSPIPGAPADQTGTWQVEQALAAVGTEKAYLAFMAIDVEPFFLGNSTVQQRIKRIEEAVQAVERAGLTPVIYTKESPAYPDQKYWSVITGNTNRFMRLPLWDTRWDGIANLNANWVPYGSWTSRAGKQYVGDDTKLFPIKVDLNVFDASMFPAMPPHDTTPPVLSNPKVNPTSLPKEGGAVTLSVDATDDRGVQSVTAEVTPEGGAPTTVTLSKIANSSTGAGGTYSGTFNAPANTKNAAQRYRVTFKATDTSGNPANPLAGPDFTVAAATPGPMISNPSLNKTTFSSEGGSVTISATITDEKGVASAWALINGATRVNMKRKGNSNSYTATWKAPKNNSTTAQTYTITLYARDTAGNPARDTAGNPEPVRAGTVTVQGKGRRQGVLEGDEDSLTLKPGADVPLTLRLLSVAGGRNGEARMFMFTLNKPARVEARLLSPTGKLIHRFEPRAAQAGLNNFVWEGKTQSGAVVARGIYLIEIVAQDAEGQAARAVGTVVVR